jgi:hypothetical protein
MRGVEVQNFGVMAQTVLLLKVCAAGSSRLGAKWCVCGGTWCG